MHELSPGQLLELAVRNESHILVTGPPGAGKTTLVKLALAEARYPALVVDYLGNYEDGALAYVDYYGIYPLNPFEYLNVHDFIDALSTSIQVLYGPVYGVSPAQELILMEAVEDLEAGGEEVSVPRILTWLRANSRRFSQQDERNALKALVRRMEALFNNPLYSIKTHPVLARWLEGRLRGQVGVRLRGLGLYPAVAYTNILLTIVARHEFQGPIPWRFIVVDEAQYYAPRRLEGLWPFEEAVRVGRNFKTLFIAITQNPGALSERVLDVFKIHVDFSASGNVARSAKVAITATEPGLVAEAPVKGPYDTPILTRRVVADPGALKARPAVTYSSCVGKCGQPPRAIVKGGVVRDLASANPCLWACLSG